MKQTKTMDIKQTIIKYDWITELDGWNDKLSLYAYKDELKYFIKNLLINGITKERERTIQLIESYPKELREMFNGHLPYIFHNIKIPEDAVMQIYNEAFKDVVKLLKREDRLKNKLEDG